MNNIYNNLIKHKDSDYYPFHMPGHKRNHEMIKKYGIWNEGLSPFDIDITEIDNFDNLHNPESIIKKAESLAAVLYGAKESIYSVNGSTGAILAVLGLISRGETVLIARNCHKSVYHGVELYGLVPHYLVGKTDEYGMYLSLEPQEVEDAFKLNNSIKMVVITSPTYEGVVSDIGEIAEICHKYGAYLMVDEAHGAHFGFDKYFPESAVRLGADFVVQSLHKTLPSFTQTAILHICLDNETLIRRIRRQFNILETSSPSYIFLAGMENSLILIRKHGEELFSSYKERLVKFRNEMALLKNIRLCIPPDSFAYDNGKLVMSAGMNLGAKLYKLLYEKYHLVMEMKSKDYVVAMTSIFDTDEAFERLSKALFALDKDETFFKLDNEANFDYTLRDEAFNFLPKIKLLPFEAVENSVKFGKQKVKLEEAEGLIAADYVYFYPPGIPILVPGEVIDRDTVAKIKIAVSTGIDVYGGCDGNGIFVCADGKKCYGKGQHI